MSIAQNLISLTKSLPKDVTLVAVSKTKPVEDLMEAYRAGHRVFGENKVQEMVHKWEQMPQDINWHMIGHLQRNKVKYIAPFVALIHGVDSERLLQEIDKQAAKHQRIIPCLLQIHIAQESTKFGLSETELDALIAKSVNYPNVQLRGLMGMASFTEDTAQIQKEFAVLKNIFDRVQSQLTGFDVLSMGMSGDYTLAIEQGSTMIRVGSKIFGARNY
ncbi:MAG: YggS family pyridoxal phosphate-dependent enzyme [Flavobacteriaceae bacterium]